jgi:hypothetical protein
MKKILLIIFSFIFFEQQTLANEPFLDLYLDPYTIENQRLRVFLEKLAQIILSRDEKHLESFFNKKSSQEIIDVFLPKKNSLYLKATSLEIASVVMNRADLSNQANYDDGIRMDKQFNKFSDFLYFFLDSYFDCYFKKKPLSTLISDLNEKNRLLMRVASSSNE